jgi:rfaE bifunctional protein nucleotidyltransferase chain/domain/rfaE bifunctional protein kinase chain/domain
VTALVIVGDVLLDRDVEGAVHRLSPDAPVPVVDDCHDRVRAGGAGLAATLAVRAGHQVQLVTAIGRDAAGDLVREQLADAGVEVVDVGLTGDTPEKVRVRAGTRTLLRLDRTLRGGSRPEPATSRARAAVRMAPAVLVADYGYGVAADAALRSELTGRAARAPVVWDPHARGPAPVPGTTLVTPNRAEATRFVPEVPGAGLGADSERARRLRRRWDVAAVCITLGDEGAVLALRQGLPYVIGAAPAVGDPCGAGDCFAVAATAALAAGADAPRAVEEAVAVASAFVAGGGLDGGERPAAPDREPAVTDRMGAVSRVRAAGGVVVATGGCFDLLHAGHVELLRAARALGDCLVVCLNSDASVRRLKGAGRPIVGEADRAAVLESLAYVDAVEVFDEDTPAAVLRRLQPDVFVKGSDYAGRELEEAAVLGEWGGETVLVPVLEGRSTTSLIQRALADAG